MRAPQRHGNDPATPGSDRAPINRFHEEPDMAVTTSLQSSLRTLRALSSGGVYGAGDSGYDEARMPWNVVDQRPAAVVKPETESDIQFAIAFARESGLRVNVQGTGHNAAPLGDMSDTLLIQTGRMRGVEIDATGRRARVQAGAWWQDVVPAASEAGLLALHGSSPNVGITGYSLGGGIGYYARKLGLATNSVTAIELVTADGDLVRADAEHEADLFWALRGGGGNFGVVTALEFKLYPAEAVYAGMMFWPWERGEEVLGRWAEWTREVPDEVTSMGRLLQIPDMPEAPDFLRGKQIAIINGAYLGDEEEGRRIFAPLREMGPEMDLFGMMPPVGLSGLHGDPEDGMPIESQTAIVDALPREAIQKLMAAAGPGTGSALLMAELRHLGGAAGRSGDGHGALDRVDGEYVMFAAGLALDDGMRAKVRSDADGLKSALAPYGHGGHYLNFAEHRVDTRTAYSDDAYAKLQRIRSQVDPDCVFRANHEIA
jgi:FAD/FMN-containing dehydrogenase